MRYQSGFSLVELMIGVMVGLIVLVGAEQLFVNTLLANSGSVRIQRFEQTIQVLGADMVSEIRRAGYKKPEVASLTAQSNSKYYYPQTNCITLSHSTLSSDEEFYGFKLNSADGSVYYYNSAAANANCSNMTGWISITDPSLIKVTGLTFSYSGSVLIAVNIIAEAQGVKAPDGGVIRRDVTFLVRVRNS